MGFKLVLARTLLISTDVRHSLLVLLLADAISLLICVFLFASFVLNFTDKAASPVDCREWSHKDSYLDHI